MNENITLESLIFINISELKTSFIGMEIVPIKGAKNIEIIPKIKIIL
jgi:hypothetical protein